MEKKFSFKQGEEKREELELPTLHFVVMDQWLDVIGDKALLAWLKFYTWCDRDRAKGDKPNDIDLWEQSKVPYSFKMMIKKLGVGRDTFYNKIIKPLWNVGLIDIEEYEDSQNTGQKPMNIIVYKYPQNDKKLSFVPIEQVRNYDSDYSSTAKSFAKKGGRPKKEKIPANNDIPENDDSAGGSISEQGGFSLGTGGVLPWNRGGFSLGTEGGSEIGDNNILNTNTNTPNNINNSLNDFNNTFNTSKEIKEEEEEEHFEINRYVSHFLKEELKLTDYIITDIIKHMKINKITSFTRDQMVRQNARNHKWIIENNAEIREFGYFFVNGILKHEPSSEILKINRKVKNTIENEDDRKSVPFYNWLES